VAYQDDPTGADSMRDLVKRVRRLEAGSPLGNSSISKGSLRIASAEGLIVEGSAKISGILRGIGQFIWESIFTVTGAALFSGTFTANGTTRFEGDTSQIGAFHVVGPTDVTGDFTARGTNRLEGDTTQVGAHHVQGNQDITGTLAVKGTASLESRLTVNSPGDIRLGGTIPMTIGNATVSFDSGGNLAGYSGGVRLKSGGTQDLVVSTGGVSITGASGVYLTVSGAGHLLGGHGTTTSAANVFINSTSGLLSRVTSAARFKVDPQPMILSGGILDVPVKDWIDREALESGDPGARVPGVIAEEVEAAGGSAFVTYDEDGQIIGVAYDRLAIARTQVLAARLDAAMEEIRLLREQVG